MSEKDLISLLINQFIPAVAVIIVGWVVKETKVLIPSIQKLLEHKFGEAKTKQIEEAAWKVWRMVDEHFRVTEFVGDKIKAKQDMFDQLLLKKMPYLTKDQIYTLRQELAGIVNKGKEAVVNNSNIATIDTQRLTDLQNKAQAYDKLQSALQDCRATSDSANSRSDASTYTVQNNSASQPTGQVNASLV